MEQNEYIKRACEGDHAAFKKLVNRLEPVVASTVTGMLGQCPEAEDVGQETFIRLYRSLDKFRGESNLKTYVTRIAMNLSINELKRRKRKNILFSSHHEIQDVGVEDYSIAQNENEAAIQWALKKLNAKHRSVIVLRLIDGYSVKETADILNVPQGTVLSRLARAQEKLKDILTPIIGIRK